jgi:hypothetical protein
LGSFQSSGEADSVFFIAFMEGGILEIFIQTFACHYSGVSFSRAHRSSVWEKRVLCFIYVYDEQTMSFCSFFYINECISQWELKTESRYKLLLVKLGSTRSRHVILEPM